MKFCNWLSGIKNLDTENGRQTISSCRQKSPLLRPNVLSP